jgi:hypothetical protein
MEDGGGDEEECGTNKSSTSRTTFLICLWVKVREKVSGFGSSIDSKGMETKWRPILWFLWYLNTSNISQKPEAWDWRSDAQHLSTKSFGRYLADDWL